MNIDEINDIDFLKQLLKNHMVKMLKTIKTPTHIYKKGEYYFYYYDENKDGIFIYYDTPDIGLLLFCDEIYDDRILEISY